MFMGGGKDTTSRVGRYVILCPFSKDCPSKRHSTSTHITFFYVKW